MFWTDLILYLRAALKIADNRSPGSPGRWLNSFITYSGYNWNRDTNFQHTGSKIFFFKSLRFCKSCDRGDHWIHNSNDDDSNNYSNDDNSNNNNLIVVCTTRVSLYTRICEYVISEKLSTNEMTTPHPDIRAAMVSLSVFLSHITWSFVKISLVFKGSQNLK